MIDQNTTVDQKEVDNFSKMASQWWDPDGKFKPLHRFNPVRLDYILHKLCVKFDRDKNSAMPFKGLHVLDIGCGGGLLSEPMARLGAQVVGVDPSVRNIEVAKIHALSSGLDIDYRAQTAEDLIETGLQFDVILNMEVVEHVSNVPLFIQNCGKLLKPNGVMFVATINRTFKARALAIFAAERILRWLPLGTHTYEKLVKPSELKDALQQTDMNVLETVGVFFNPFSSQWNLSKDTDVNYMMLAEKTK
jgi:2-polyprenyl-6-hydroxyphenyl methylase / 3-demethylubiquinone-9 3-methyltransferase